MATTTTTTTKPKKAPATIDPDLAARNGLEALNKRRFLYTPSCEIYGGVKGLYDYGPIGCAISANVIDFWREWFILEEDMLQISTASLTPEAVFIASGHVEKFEDMMVKDDEGEAHRADHLLEDHIENLLKNPKLTELEIQKLKDDYARADDFSLQELAEKLKEYSVKSPEGRPISEPYPFNLMFSSMIGATGKSKGYFRPETAQGMFVNFGRLYSAAGSKLPFAAAQIGPAFRNEIAPRSGLLRVREFTLAEIEHFVDPENKDHEKFDNVREVVLPFYPQANQLGDKQIVFYKVADAVESGLIHNQTLAYFLARTYLWLLRLGVKPDRIRFRQHLTNEMAHYACGCWDAEIRSSYGWVECVGHADRSAYDLTVHAEASKKKSTLEAFVLFPDGPREVDVVVPVLDRKKIGGAFKGEAKSFFEWFECCKEDQNEMRRLKARFEGAAEDETIDQRGLPFKKDMITFKTEKKRVTGKNITPGVIEPSYGIGRIIYSVLETSFWVRPVEEKGEEDDKLERCVLSIPPIIAPYKCCILPLISSSAPMLKVTKDIESRLKRYHITAKVDKSSLKIGKRYARADEIGIPFAITVDEMTLEDGNVTFRERDSTHQVRLPIADIPQLIVELVDEIVSWSDVYAKYPQVTRD